MKKFYEDLYKNYSREYELKALREAKIDIKHEIEETVNSLLYLKGRLSDNTTLIVEIDKELEIHNEDWKKLKADIEKIDSELNEL